jgi:hypothetical protein
MRRFSLPNCTLAALVLLFISLTSCNFKFTKEFETEAIPEELHGTVIFKEGDKVETYHISATEIVMEDKDEKHSLSAKKLKGHPILVLGHKDWKGYKMLVKYNNNAKEFVVQTIEMEKIQELVSAGNLKAEGVKYQFKIDEEMPDFLKKVEDCWGEKSTLERK